MLVVIDEFSRECLAILVARRLRSDDVLALLTELFVVHGPPDHIRSDNGPEFCVHAVRDWLARLDVSTLFIEPGSPWENGYCESFNGKLRDELLNTEIFYTLNEATILIEHTTLTVHIARSGTDRRLPKPSCQPRPLWLRYAPPDRPRQKTAACTNIAGGRP